MYEFSRTIKSNLSNPEISSSVYNSKREFIISHTHGDLEQMFVKCILSTSLVATIPKSCLGLKLFKTARLHNGSSTIAVCTPYSNIARLDLVANEALGRRIDKSVKPIGNFASGNVVLYLPMMFWFSDSYESRLSLNGRKQLYLELITNDSKNAMGLSTDLTTLDCELFCKYSPLKDISMVPRPVISSYSTFQEKPVLLLAGSTEKSFLMTCPYQCFYVHFLIISSDASRGNITGVKINTPTGELMNIDFNMNYTMSSSDSFNELSTLSLQFGPRKLEQKNTIKFSQEMQGTIVTLTYDTLTLDSYIYTTCEHYTKLGNPDDPSDLSNQITGLFYTTQNKF